MSRAQLKPCEDRLLQRVGYWMFRRFRKRVALTGGSSIALVPLTGNHGAGAGHSYLVRTS
jgi:hypothetical protein